MRILQLTDLHFSSCPFAGEDVKTSDLVKRLVSEHKPDLIIATGDLISGYKTLDGLAVFEQVVNLLDCFGVPVAITYGNHDSEVTYIENILNEALQHSGLLAQQNQYIQENYPAYYDIIQHFDQIRPYSRRDLHQIVARMDNHVEKNGLAFSADREMYYFDVDAATRLLFLDSGDYDFTGLSLYGAINFEQQEWLEKYAADEKRGSHLFIHIPLPEYAAAVQAGMANGNQAEKVCAPDYNTGTWARLKFRTNVKAVYCGHDHENDYSADYHGIQLNYGRSTGFNSYGDVPKGARLIEISPHSWKTTIVE